MKNQNSTTKIATTLDDLSARGWSFIPLYGDLLPGSEKAPALSSWAIYQRRQPTAAERDTWFNQYGFHVAGVVLGKVSGVVVVDIDTPEAEAAFASALPDLTQTFTVRSGNRGLPHYYYAIAADQSVPSSRTRDIELRTDGHYVVAPNMTIRGKTWQVVNFAPPRQLTADDARRLVTFIQTLHRKPSTLSPTTPPPTRPTTDVNALSWMRLSRANLLRRYGRLARLMGRNNALFNCACYARDRGWSAERTLDSLTPYHVAQQPNGHHTPETPAQRQAEARRTIQSAFSQPPRPTDDADQPPHKQLPNSVREALIIHKLTNVARLIDGLLMCGLSFGDTFTVKSAHALLGEHGVGRSAIYQAVMELIPLSPRTPQTPYANPARRSAMNTKQCLFGRVTNPVKNGRGRPVMTFVIPSLDDLCAWLDVENRGGDSLQLADLRSPAAYRAALHCALFDRAPGQYSRRWQAARIGMSIQTCRRYDRRGGVTVTPRYRETPLTWRNVDQLIGDEPIDGQFLMDADGKRYPPLSLVARRLLKRGGAVSLMVQATNFYGVDPAPPAITAPVERPPAPLELPFLPTAPVAPTVPLVAGTAPPSAPVAPLSAPSKADHSPSAHRPQTAGLPSADSAGDGLVDALYEALRAINPAQSITRKTAQEWVTTFGEKAIRHGLKVTQTRRNVRNAAGFLLTWLRSEAREKARNSILIQNT